MQLDHQCFGPTWPPVFWAHLASSVFGPLGQQCFWSAWPAVFLVGLASSVFSPLGQQCFWSTLFGCSAAEAFVAWPIFIDIYIIYAYICTVIDMLEFFICDLSQTLAINGTQSREWNAVSLLFSPTHLTSTYTSRRYPTNCLSEATNACDADWTQGSSSMSSLADCAVVDITTDIHQPSFSCFLWHAGWSIWVLVFLAGL